VLIEHRGLGARAAERRAWREDHAQILLAFLVALDPFGHGEELAEIDQSGNARAFFCMKGLLTHPAEAQGAEARAVGDAQLIIDFVQRAWRSCLALSAAAFGALHEAAAPCVGRQIPDRAEQPCGGLEGAAAKLQRGVEREIGVVAQPVRMILEDDRRAVADAFGRVECSDTQRRLAECDMHLDVSHCCQVECSRSAVCAALSARA